MNDKFLMEECQNATSLMLNSNMDLNRVCQFIKSYQEIYIKLDKEDNKLSKSFTFKEWFKKCCTYQ
jgi:hypothetical protein